MKKKSRILQQPRRLRFPKWHKLYLKKHTYAKGVTNLLYGSYGLQALKSIRMTWEQAEAARQKASRLLRKKARLWVRIFPQVPRTKKPKEVRMGKGKGAVDSYWIKIEAGQVVFEVSGVNADTAELALKKAAKRLATPCAFIERGIFMQFK